MVTPTAWHLLVREKLVILTFDFFTGIRTKMYVEKILSDQKCAKRNPEDD